MMGIIPTTIGHAVEAFICCVSNWPTRERVYDILIMPGLQANNGMTWRTMMQVETGARDSGEKKEME